MDEISIGQAFTVPYIKIKSFLNIDSTEDDQFCSMLYRGTVTSVVFLLPPKKKDGRLAIVKCERQYEIERKVLWFGVERLN